MYWVAIATGLLVLSASTTLMAVVGWLQVSHLRFATYHRFKGLDLPHIGVGEYLALHLRELFAWITLGWWALTASLRDGLIRPAEVTGPTVLCVHGFTQNGSNFWGIRRALRRAGRPSRAVFLGFPFRRLSGYAPRLESALDGLQGPVDVVCHSMGGIILRLALQRRPELASRIRRIVTLGSPHRGTAAGRGLPIAADVRELGRSSAVLAELPSFAELAPQAEVTTVAGVRDLVVYPQSSALLAGSHQVVLPGVGHGGLLVHRVAVEAVLNALDAREA